MRPDAHTLVAAYAVDALEESERTDVEAHLAQCDVCDNDLRGYREALASLAAATAEAPPVRLREAVMARVRNTPQLPPLTPEFVEAARFSDGWAAMAPNSRPLERTLDEPDQPVGAGPGLTRTVFALAASLLTVLALGAGGWGWSTANELSDVRAQQAAVQRVLAADDVVSVSGRPELAGGVRGDEVVLLSSASADGALLLPAGLPAAPEGSTWQAWTVHEAGPVSAGVFDVRGGEAVALSASLQGAESVAVTLEPAGGSSAPTADPVLSVPLT